MKIVSFFESIKIWWWIEKIQSDLSKWLVDLGYEFIHLVLEDTTPRNDYKWKIISLNDKFIHGFWFKKIVALFRLWYKTAKYCKEEKINIIIWHWDFFYMVISISKILFWNKTKCIWVVHTTIWIWPKYIRKMLIFLLKKLDKIVLISKEEYNTFLYHYWFLENKLEIIYNSIDIEKIDYLKNEEVNDFDFNKFTYINIWRLTYQKWQDNLIKSFNKFNKNYPDTQLLILWDWELKQEYTDLISTLNNKNIHLLWKKDNVYKYLSKSDCFILSSRFEWFPIVLMESLILKKPIISTNCPTWPSELLDGDNTWNYQITKYGILISYKDNIEENLFKSMEKIYFDKWLREQISKYNNDSSSNFSIKRNIRKWDILFQDV